jgi:FkbM family methyltransferase
MNRIYEEFCRELSRTKYSYDRILDSASRGIYLYGAGFVGKWSTHYFSEIGIPILGIIDSDERRWRNTFAGYQIINIEERPIDSESPVLISSRHAVRQIARKLEGLPNQVMSVDAFVVHREYIPLLESNEELFKHDRRSLETFYAILLSMLIGHTEPLAQYADATPFFGRYDFFNRDGEIFVDAGAYVGDSIERFIWSVNGVFREIHAFEPGQPQFNALQLRMVRLSSEWAIQPKSVILNNSALSDLDGNSQIQLSDEHVRTTLSEVFDATQNISRERVETKTLDTYFFDRSFSLLKVDVEGAEAALLRGGIKTIQRCQPRIALSVYHYPTDLLRLVELVKNINPDYQFGLGHHSSKLLETVVYCRSRYD